MVIFALGQEAKAVHIVETIGVEGSSFEGEMMKAGPNGKGLTMVRYQDQAC